MTAQYEILNGSVLDVLKQFKDSCMDACVCDPPYGFSFMGKAWDYDVPSVETWAEVLRVLKPGAPLVAFGGSRTYHRLAVGIEDAGFELRDCLMWLHGKGFPKSQDVSKAIDKAAGATREKILVPTKPGNAARRGDGEQGVSYGDSHGGFRDISEPTTDLARAWSGYGTALKPAHEPIVLARKPLEGAMVANVARWGVGGLDVDGCRIGTETRVNAPSGNHAGGSSYNMSAFGMPQDAEGRECTGRWPANLILDEEAGALLDASVAPTKSPTTTYQVTRRTLTPGSVSLAPRSETETIQGYADSGGPSRFFYCSKVSTREREAGCEHLPRRTAGEMTGGREEDSRGLDSPRAGAGGQTGGARNHHPTLKPISLTTWLAKLVKPPVAGGVIVPFSGAGSEMIGCALAGWPFVVGIEQDAEYVEIARARLAHWVKKEEAA